MSTDPDTCSEEVLDMLHPCVTSFPWWQDPPQRVFPLHLPWKPCGELWLSYKLHAVVSVSLTYCDNPDCQHATKFLQKELQHISIAVCGDLIREGRKGEEKGAAEGGNGRKAGPRGTREAGGAPAPCLPWEMLHRCLLRQFRPPILSPSHSRRVADKQHISQCFVQAHVYRLSSGTPTLSPGRLSQHSNRLCCCWGIKRKLSFAPCYYSKFFILSCPQQLSPDLMFSFY